MTSVWVIRSEYGKYSEHFLKGGYAAAGWLGEHDLTSFSSRDEVTVLYKASNSAESPYRAGASAGQIATFALDVKPGDYVITPRSETEWLDYDRVLDEPLYHALDADDGCPFSHRRKVDWASEPLRRWDLSIPFQKTLGAQKTVFRVSHTGEVLNQSQSGICIDTGLGSAANNVIPVNAGIQRTVLNVLSWTPAYAGVTKGFAPSGCAN